MTESQIPESVIIVGAGSAGSVIARRLSDAGVTVTVLEAGDDDTNPDIHDPMGMPALWHSAQDWDYRTIPQPHAADRRLHLPRGKVLGGSHALNAMIWVRGHPRDFDDWAADGNDGWSWSDVLPVYREIERFHGDGDPEFHGTDGLLDVVNGYPLDPIQQSIIDASVESGVAFNPDYNGATLDGVSQQQVTMRGPRRWNTYMAYLKPVRDRVTVETGCWVHEMIFDDASESDRPRVVGVRYEQAGEVRELRADEVILCAGALDSPRIMLRSGLGPADELAAIGIPPVADLPGVGKELHDHLLVPIVFRTGRPVGAPRSGVSVTQSHLFWKSRPELDRPDTQPIFFSVPMYYEDLEPQSPDGFSLLAGIVTPRSRGSVTLSGPGPHDPTIIDLDALHHEDDVASMLASIKQCRDIGTQASLHADPDAGGWGAEEVYPGPEVVTDEQLVRYAREQVVVYHHQVSTCRMGIDDTAVVSPRLTVHGVDGLRVADASIMPKVPTGNTNAPSVLIGEMAARFVLSGARR
ncbi:GMC family oxidoreductase N-terminal domain-containing protein [Leucobacter tardus]|uniref:GMC family oxidoreductase N-terminal domain-containing protein n=1 Tax=Leucobacter tardus TaxID=501483 RepID=A0A939TRE6_9MICO|nr:GMC family oxidoreductase N-terminal domain-containing protein [Leucobacter tardus]MBO2989937.1 GMC family oxidoreductase N-terminal domain-containing protein [Leucobacter tardus]